jgi:hypothetical protein
MATPPKVQPAYAKERVGPSSGFVGVTPGREVIVRAKEAERHEVRYDDYHIPANADDPLKGISAIRPPKRIPEGNSPLAVIDRTIHGFGKWPWFGGEYRTAEDHLSAAYYADKNGLAAQRDHHLHLCFDTYLDVLVRRCVLPWLHDLKAKKATVFRVFLKSEKRQGLRDGDFVWDFTVVERYGGTIPLKALELFDSVHSHRYQPFWGYLIAAQRWSPLPRPVPPPRPDPDPVLIGIVRGEWGYREWYISICEWI